MVEELAIKFIDVETMKTSEVIDKLCYNKKSPGELAIVEWFSYPSAAHLRIADRSTLVASMIDMLIQKH